MKLKRIAFHTLGCKLNFSETSTISRSFSKDGFERVEFSDHADVYVINSCSVTKNAEKRCKSLIRQVMKRNPEAFVAVVGCYSQLNPEELRKIPGVGLVLGNAEKFNLFEHIKRLQRLALPAGGAEVPGQRSSAGHRSTMPAFDTEVLPDNSLEKFIPSWSKDDRTRSFFKIQDGCDYYCTYCTIPLARGHSRSDTIAGTIITAREIARSEVREIVLSGVNIGDFGRMHNERLVDLLRELVKLDGIERIRISSVEPDLLHDDIIELVAGEPKLMPHFHIPLQSGSDAVLGAMGRRYNTRIFKNRVDTIRRLIPGACIAADMIVGFPAETSELFEESTRFISDLDVSYIHVFTYSERDNTRAAGISRNVPVNERSQRSKRMHLLSENKKMLFYRNNMGQHATILWENENNDGCMFGFTENYIRAKTAFKQDLVNQLQNVVLNKMDHDGVFYV